MNKRSPSPFPAKPTFNSLYWSNNAMKRLRPSSKVLPNLENTLTENRAYVAEITKCEAAVDLSGSVHLIIQYESYAGKAMLNEDRRIRKWLRRDSRPTNSNICISIKDPIFLNGSKCLEDYVKWCLKTDKYVQNRALFPTDSDSVRTFLQQPDSHYATSSKVVVLPMSRRAESITMHLNERHRPTRIAMSNV